MIKMENRWQQADQRQCLKLEKKHTFWLVLNLAGPDVCDKKLDNNVCDGKQD